MTKTLTRRTIPTAAAAHEDFTNSTGSLTGTTGSDFRYTDNGRLNDEETLQLRADAQYGIVYLVRSYNTPIAWVTKDGTVRKVKQKFSMTTSQHMGLLYLM